MVFKRKQLVVLSLVLMIVIAGYLQYSYKNSSVSVNDLADSDILDGEIADSDAPRLGEAVYVDNSDFISSEVDGKKDDSDKNDEKKDEKEKDSKKTVQASKQANSFFAQAKIDKDLTRGKNKDELEDITKDPNSSKDLKSQASEKILALIDKSEKEMAIESLIKEKGYSDVVVFMADDGSLDIVVKTESLSDIEATQIADIAARQANVVISDVHVRDIF